jgi:hypothetical protein
MTRNRLRISLAVLFLLSTAASAWASCGEVPGLAPLLAPGTVLLVGEMHGTAEAPAFVHDVTCAALAADLRVTVGLEVDRADDDAYQAYLGSDGSPAARERLLASPFWQREFQDGRGSVAMLELVESLRALRRSAGEEKLRVTLIDRPEAGADRDEAMADRVADTMALRPEDLVVVLTGNIHNRLTKGMPWNAELRPMGHRLVAARPDARVISLDMAYPGGSAWVCFGSAPSDCKAQELGGLESAEGRSGIELHDEPAGEPYSGRYYAGRLTASPPAVGAGEPAAEPVEEAAREPATNGEGA